MLIFALAKIIQLSPKNQIFSDIQDQADRFRLEPAMPDQPPYLSPMTRTAEQVRPKSAIWMHTGAS
ncbi:MAG: hypothetical protein DM484_07705 [Candidatus Methylumidiphilus alinenensis]|uniref:Uncharacterized protein n=1 Tax=Candidatus Methylumidiphilus alinenensis TaxID=2202197 RepID=A0A2W4RG48_9GAMM|nr:MAG: hypothetical protein DM484_07705 [Candidatus Methylumidiphilus alinenensis]